MIGPALPRAAAAVLALGAATLATVFPQCAGYVLAATAATIAVGQFRRPVRLRDVPRVGPFDAWDVLALVAGCLSVAWIVAGPGIPSLRHDWNFQADGTEFARSLIESVLSSWNTSDLGSPTFRVGIFPWTLGIAALGHATAPAVAFFVSYTISFAASFWTMRRAAFRLTGCDPLVAVLVAFGYAATPAFFERVVAGHYMHAVIQALYPAIVLLGLRVSERPWRQTLLESAVAALLLGAVGQQPFALVIDSATFGALVAFRKPLVAGTIFSAVAVMNAPEIVAALIAPASTFDLVHAVGTYETSQSAPPALLLHLAGSVGRYWERVSNPVSDVAGAALVIVSALGSARLALTGRGLYLFGCLCALMIVGVYGPLWPIENALFVGFAPFSIVRELYDLAPFVAFAAALGVAAWTNSAVDMRYDRIVLAVAVVLAAEPVFTQAAFHLVPHLDDALVERAVAELPGSGCVFWLPGIDPMRTASGLGEGSDPVMRVEGPHAGISASQPDGAIQRAYWLLDRDPTTALRWIRGLGCSYFGIDRRVASIGDSGPSVRRMIANAHLMSSRKLQIAPLVDILAIPGGDGASVLAPTVTVSAALPIEATVGGVTLSVEDPANADALRALGFDPGTWTAFVPSRSTADPTAGFVAAANHWRAFPEASLLPGEAVVATAPILHMRAGDLVAWWQGTIPVLGAARTSSRRIPNESTLRFPGRVALVGQRSGAPFARPYAIGSIGRTIVRRAGPLRYRVTALTKVDAIVLRVRYATGWKIATASPASHFRADGWANGWFVDLNPGQTIVIDYAPAAAIATAEYAAALAYALVALGATVLCAKRYSDRESKGRMNRSPSARP